MASDLESGSKPSERRSRRRWHLGTRHSGIGRPQGTSSIQEYHDLATSFEQGTSVSLSGGTDSASVLIEYLRIEIARHLDRFAAVTPPEARDLKNKDAWIFATVRQLYKDMTEGDEFSLAHAAIQLQANGTLCTRDQTNSEQQAFLCVELVFTIVGILTTLYAPRASDGRKVLRIRIGPALGSAYFGQITCDAIDAREAERPLSDALLGFGQLGPCYEYEKEEKSILGSYFHAHALRTIGKIRITWTDLLTAHLDFDFASKTLYIFQRPTFCLLNIPDGPGAQRASVLTSCLKGTEVSRSSQHEVAEYMKEVLLSIHMIFGQSAKSRNEFNRGKISRARSPVAPDPLLTTLCTQDWPFADWTHQPKKRYLIHEDFPLLGRKIDVVRRYVEGKQPKGIWSIWKDDRNPLQWWTFWAVLIIGGLGLVFAAAQTALAGAQLYYTIHGPSVDSPRHLLMTVTQETVSPMNASRDW